MKLVQGVKEKEEEQRMKLIQEARHLAIAAPVLIPILVKKREIAFNKLISLYRDGKTEFTTLVAELSVIETLNREIMQKIEYVNLMEDRQNGSSKQSRE